MGFFSNLLGANSAIEDQLVLKYTPAVQRISGFTPQDAKRACRDLVSRAKADSTKAGSSQVPNDQGDLLLKAESSLADIKEGLQSKRKQGVTDDDIRWWWNMHDFERMLILRLDEMKRYGSFTAGIHEHGLTPEEAMKRVKKLHPIFGNPDDPAESNWEDRPLPYELIKRVDNYIGKRKALEAIKFDTEVSGATSFNAFIRRQLHKGTV